MQTKMLILLKNNNYSVSVTKKVVFKLYEFKVKFNRKSNLLLLITGQLKKVEIKKTKLKTKKNSM